MGLGSTRRARWKGRRSCALLGVAIGARTLPSPSLNLPDGGRVDPTDPLGGGNMAMRNWLMMALAAVALSGAARAAEDSDPADQKVAADKEKVKADQEKIKAQREQLKADRAAVKAD